ncbi:hypothetical protein [Luedemannella helvata]|uniref:Exporter of polyketide antibiotics n=1 Tax=Luedemannella helvata TaxID=349315 RepID=A0ABN2JY28_9ACTN
MSTGTNTRDRAPGRAVTGLALRQVRRGGLIMVLFAATMPAIVVGTYGSVTADPTAMASLSALATNPAIRTLFGEPLALDTAGGFTVWRIGTVLAVALGVWSVLTVTRTTRGEEEAGRWGVLLAGLMTPRQVMIRHIAVVSGVAVAAGTAVTAVLWTAGPDRVSSIVFGAGLAGAGLFAAAVAALAAQVFPTRAPATGATIALLGVGLLMRMVGDGLPWLGWLRWLSPFGLLAVSSPYHGDHPLPLLALYGGTALIAAAAVAAAGHRDIGGGLVNPTAGRRARLRLLGSVAAFAVRRAIGPVGAWSAGIAAYFLLIGLTAASVTDFLADNTVFTDSAARAGFVGLDAVKGFTATLFTLLALPVGAFTAVRMGAFVAAEGERRLAPLAAQPVSRIRLLGADVVATTGGALLLVTVAALATWVGVTAVGGGLSLPEALYGTWNTLPIVLLSLGAATLATGWVPRLALLAGLLPATGGFLFKVIAESTDAPARVLSASPFAHLAPVPFAEADAAGSVAMTSLAVLMIMAGAVGYRLRDLRG